MKDGIPDEKAVRGIYAFTLPYVVIFFVGVGLFAAGAARSGFEIELLDVASAPIATPGTSARGSGRLPVRWAATATSPSDPSDVDRPARDISRPGAADRGVLAVLTGRPFCQGL